MILHFFPGAIHKNFLSDNFYFVNSLQNKQSFFKKSLHLFNFLMQQKTRPQCTVSEICRDMPMTQHLYRCKSCGFTIFETCCEACAKFCHSGHELEDLGYVYGICSCGRGCKKCHCFLEHPVEGDTDIPDGKERQCTFRRTGTEPQAMDICNCYTCHMTDTCVLCVPCSVMCHKGHSLSRSWHSASAFCDCGDPGNPICRCKLDPPSEIPPPVYVCSNFLTANKSYKQKRFKCRTCDLSYLCENCALKCHAGHDVVIMNTSYDFECNCSSKRCLILEEKEPAA